MISRKMMLEAALSLPPEQRADLVKDIWDSLATDSAAVKLSDAQEEELERCWQEYLENPKAGDDWETTRAWIEGRQL
jgi:putative addiction module component (TIGR02574 family)